jgi:hypothetical protein
MNSPLASKTYKQASPVVRFVESLRGRGLSRTIQTGLSIAEDWCFDWRHGTDTVGRVHQGQLNVDHPNKSSAHPYIPTRGRAFKRLMSTLSFPQGSVFVDYGSGKGKVLLLASRLGFKRVVGIEYSRELHGLALENLARFGKRSTTPIESIWADATEYVLRDDENVFYFFNPFEIDVMRGVIRQIKASIERKPRKIWVIYFDPLFTEPFEVELGLRRTRVFFYGG